MPPSLFKEIKEWKQGYLKYLAYSYKLTVWLYLNRLRWLIRVLKKHSGICRRALLIVAGLLAGLIANHYGVAALTKDALSSYLVAVAAMTGGTMAIIFSISIFLLQGVADLYSSKYLEEYTNNWRDQIIYIIVIIITLGLFGTGLLVGEKPNISQEFSSYVVLISLGLIGLVFSLIDWQYELVRKKIGPANAIFFLEKKGLSFLKDMQYNAGKIADLLSAREVSLTKEMALAAAYNNVLQPFIRDLDRQLETLVEISMKLSDRNEIETTKRGFTAVHNLLIKFFEARKTSSLVLPAGTAFLAVESDSQSFLSRNFDRLNKAGEKFINEGKEENATHIIDIYNSLAAKAKDINFLSQHNENPILDNLVGYLNLFIENGKRTKNIEVVYQGSRVLGNIALIAAEKGLSATVYGIQDNLLQIAVFGLTEKNTVIVDSCISTYLAIIEAVFLSDRIVARYQFNTALKNIATITGYGHKLIKSGYLPDNFTTRISLSKGYSELYTIVAVIVNRYFKLNDAREKRRCRDDLTKLFEEINSSLRRLSENIKDCDSTLLDSIGRLLFDINHLIIQLYEKNEFTDQRADFLIRLGWNIYVPSWFVYHAEKFDGGSNAFNTLTDSISKTGILIAEKIGNRKLVIDCIDTLYGITKQCLEKTTDKYGFDEPRVLEKACYLGILALKKGWSDVVTEIGLKIYEFEAEYFKKYFTNIPAGIDPENHRVIGLPHSDQLYRELWRWRNDFEREALNGNLRIRDDAEAMMYELIEPIDIDRFTFEVWGSFPAGSEVEKEIELKFSRRQLLTELKRLVAKKAKEK